MANQIFLEGIKGLITSYGALVEVREHKKLTAHQLRVFLAIYFLQQTKVKKITRRAVATHTYIWYTSVIQAVKYLIEIGLIQPLIYPKCYLYLTPAGVDLIKQLEKHYKRYASQLETGKEVTNKPKPGQ